MLNKEFWNIYQSNSAMVIQKETLYAFMAHLE